MSESDDQIWVEFWNELDEYTPEQDEFFNSYETAIQRIVEWMIPNPN